MYCCQLVSTKFELNREEQTDRMPALIGIVAHVTNAGAIADSQQN